MCRMPRLYDDLATWWPLMSAPADYAEEAEFYGASLVAACTVPPQTVLELGSGGGNNASHMKTRFRLSLVDPSPGMLAHSRTLNPECEHIEGDMRTVRLGREFDAVFIHDAICYMTSEDELRQAVHTAFVHCRPGGGAVFCPDYVRENFVPGVEDGGHDGAGRSLRYLEWMTDPDPDDTTYTVDYAYMLREGDRSVRVEHDRHLEGLFARERWLTLIAEAGFEVSALPFEHSELEPGAHEVFIGRKPRR